MRRLTAVVAVSLVFAAIPAYGGAQDARQRQAAAEAYDRGTAAYLEGSYEEAGQWFETAHRMAPAAPALMQAIRAHEHNQNIARAATLALELQRAYSGDKAAVEYAAGALSKYASTLLRVEVECDQDCKLDLDGKLLEYLTFFATPGVLHQLTATFESGSKKASIQGNAGQTRSITFQAPPPPATPTKIPLDTIETNPLREDDSRAPLSPLYTWIGLGVTGALGIATVISGVDANAGVPDYEKAAATLRDCQSAKPAAGCAEQESAARSLLKEGESRELRTNVLIGVTAFAAVGTGVIALFLTDWSGSGNDASDSSARFEIQPRAGGLMSVVKGRF